MEADWEKSKEEAIEIRKQILKIFADRNMSIGNTIEHLLGLLNDLEEKRNLEFKKRLINLEDDSSYISDYNTPIIWKEK